MKKLLALSALCLVVLLCASAFSAALADIPPAPNKAEPYVFDYTASAVMRSEDVSIMADAARTLEQKTGAQVAAVLVDFLDGEDVDLYAHDLFNSWKIGSKKDNSGALLLFSRGDRDITIYAGTGLERTLSGPVRAQILDDVGPTLTAGAYSAGLRNAFLAICNRVARSYGVTLPNSASQSQQNNYYAQSSGDNDGRERGSTNWLGTLIAVLVLWSIVKNIFRPRYGRGGRGGFFPFLLGSLLGNMFGGSRSGFPPMGGGWGNMGNFRGGSGGGSSGNGGGWGGGSGRGSSTSRKF